VWGAKIPPYVVIDSQEPDRIVAFWRELLGVEVRDYRDEGRYVTLEPSPLLSGSMMLVFQRVPEAKVGKNRVHVDMWVDDLDLGTARVEALGGRSVEPGTTVDEGGWRSRVMSDPEGNEFCICLTPDHDPR
jgi:predicted enzyme related to lactoylglutathione lyase